jgi:plastocyanin
MTNLLMFLDPVTIVGAVVRSAEDCRGPPLDARSHPERPTTIKEVLVRKLLPVLLIAIALTPLGAVSAGAAHGETRVRQVTIPQADQFTPFALTIHAGDIVRWVNTDGDPHTVVSDDAFDTAGHHGTDQILNASGGRFTLRFLHAGTFVYYCRFHAHLDAQNQPVAPGPDGGIQDSNGNYGTPMSGVITVLPD